VLLENLPRGVRFIDQLATSRVLNSYVELLCELAPAVGNMHGMLKSMVAGDTRKRLDIERIRAIKAEAGIFMTLHGASGTDDDDLREAIAAGITVVHINTEVRHAWRRGLDAALAKQPDEIVPYKLLPQVVDSVRRVVADRLALFSTGRRARPASH